MKPLSSTGLDRQAGALQGWGGVFALTAPGAPSAMCRGADCDRLEELSSRSALFSVKGTHPAIVRLTEMHCVQFWGEFFSYRRCLIELKETFV